MFYGKRLELNEWNQQSPVQVMRSTIVIGEEWRIDKGLKSWYAVYFDQSDAVFSNILCCKIPFDTAAFDGIEIGNTADDVLQVDKDTVLQPYEVATEEYVSSTHLLQDGRIVSLQYDANGTIIEKGMSSFSILPQDVPQ